MMAPLRSKINHTLHKINDKFKRQSTRSAHSQDCDVAQGKHPRTLPTESFLLPSGQVSASSQATGSSSQAGEDVSQLPRTSGSGSATGLAESSASGSGGFSEGSSSSVEFLDQNPVVMQAAATPLGTLSNPIAVGGLGDPHNTVDLTSPSPTSPHGQKRYWADPSPLDSPSVDYTVGQKSKMYRSAANHPTNLPIPGCLSSSTRYPTRAGFERQNLKDDLGFSSAWAGELKSESHLRSTQYRPEDDLLAFREKILASRCHRCSSPLVARVESVTKRTKDVLAAKGVLHPHLSCAKCKAVGCVACGIRSTQSGKDLPYTRMGQGVSLAWCCNEGRLFLVWSLCCGPEYKKLDGQDSPATTGKLNALKGRLRGPKPDASAPAKAKEPLPRALSKGIGYGGEEFSVLNGTMGIPFDAQLFSHKENRLTPEERLLPAYFSALGLLLSSFGDSQQLGTFDKEPPAMVKFMLSRSPLLPKAAELLRNDSMENIADRRATYEPLLGLTRTISRHKSISAVVYDDYMLYPLEEQLIHFSSPRSGPNSGPTSGNRPNQRDKGKQPDQGSSIVKIVEKLARQCRHLNHVASENEQFKVGDSSGMLTLSRLICDLAAEHEANRGLAAEHIGWALSAPSVQMQTASNVLTRSREAEKAREDLRELHRDASVTDVDDQELLRNFRFQAQAAGLNAAVPTQGRMKKLVSQIAMLRTSLPEGIWVRHGSSRLDVMKVLMVGPKGTPYENGLFEFDLFCPFEFPTKAPLVFFRTTGGGKVRFNPNLYDDGKVCLSVLGTWAGPGWNGAYSTLLQVLVSIQAMILVEEPWYNEPGREHTPNKTASKNYNTQIQGYTIEHAMLEWLTNRLARVQTTTTTTSGISGWALNTGGMTTRAAVPRPPPYGPLSAVLPCATTTMGGSPLPLKDDPIWGEVVRKHFAANGKAMVETVKKWKQPATAKDTIARLTDALAQHGFL